jgi:hypothetical protein
MGDTQVRRFNHPKEDMELNDFAQNFIYCITVADKYMWRINQNPDAAGVGRQCKDPEVSGDAFIVFFL